MQLASHGARALARQAPPGSRGLHVPPAFRLPRTTFTQRIVSQTRTVLSRFVTHLTTPGIGSNVSAARSFHAANPSIHQRLSFAARHTLARPLQPTLLPRAPVVQRTVAQVGLGTARSFSTSRPIFQHLAENVPVVGRAFYEADWELKMREEMAAMRRPTKKTSAIQKSKETLKPTSVAKAIVEDNNELDHYFPAPSVPAVTTHLLVPLAPTPTSRAPLPEFPVGRLPLRSLLDIHDQHETQSLRVASLFQRLDNADVWTRGAICSAYSSSAGPDGVCNVLKIEFIGWSMAAVRGVIGESGTGWCVLEEEHSAALDPTLDSEDGLSDTSSLLSGMATPLSPNPAQSLVLPTLDFSSSFRGSWSASSAGSDPAIDDGAFSYAHSNDSSEWSDVSPASEPERWFGNSGDNPWVSSESLSSVGSGSSSWLGFSSDFGQRQRQAESALSAEGRLPLSSTTTIYLSSTRRPNTPPRTFPKAISLLSPPYAPCRATGLQRQDIPPLPPQSLRLTVQRLLSSNVCSVVSAITGRKISAPPAPVPTTATLVKLASGCNQRAIRGHRSPFNPFKVPAARPFYFGLDPPSSRTPSSTSVASSTSTSADVIEISDSEDKDIAVASRPAAVFTREQDFIDSDDEDNLKSVP
ncbi:hypothetical protein MKEN_01456200 [Mycena kentingensis (nom. inval.)]|nr:hypothetical protein MKEN_01456200 [Mycena kentingensis (nom. inval.)]